MTTTAIKLLDAILSSARWYREARGGTWVGWLTPDFSTVWLHNVDPDHRPEWARGTPQIEDYDWIEIMSMSDEEVEAQLRREGVDLDAEFAAFDRLVEDVRKKLKEKA